VKSPDTPTRHPGRGNRTKWETISCKDRDRYKIATKVEKMGIFTTLLLCALCVNCASIDYRPDPWTREQAIAQGAVTLLQVIDWGQTLDVSENPDKYREINPVLGDHPDRGRVNIYFACSILIKAAITWLLPTKWRKYWLAGNIAASGYLVKHNYNAGIEINF